MLQFKKQIDANGINEEIVQALIQSHKEDHDRTKQLYERYKADVDGPKIFKRGPARFDGFGTNSAIRRLDDKVNNLLNNAFDVDIVDTKIGYMFGHPIAYDVDNKDKAIKEQLSEFLLRNNAEDDDAECGKMAAICGYSARLAYIDKEGKERIKNIDPWEAVFIGEDIHEPIYSLRYYSSDNTIFAEFYDYVYIYYFSQAKGNDFELVDIQPHMFEYNPLFGIANNKELKADAEKVLALIDAYDRTLSDASNEIEQYRLAYLILKGMGADEDTLKELKKSGIFELFGENDDVRYLTKDINDTMIENHLNRLEDNIMRFAKSVNFADEKFAGNASGIAMKLKMMALENKCITMERKFTSSLRYQFKVLFSAWAKRKGVNREDYLKVFFGFKRNLPANILDEARSTKELKGHVSERTRLSLLSFVDNVDYELDEMQQDALLYGDQLEPLGGEEDEPTGDS
ncbi:phage portal protein [Metabacillus fastidiosus]|uniref:phage portal protein n=1 Tax=Metabacillus fastidiosus TaxID=1458 RepID=UPI0008243245|nr:phage portal protein [Metabacillus fastidiosus]MED4461852.1 phage portal protein [Metabacillus fastidiosus]